MEKKLGILTPWRGNPFLQSAFPAFPPSQHTHSACRSWLRNNLTETSRFCMQGRAELRLLTSNKHMITLFTISLWHPLILESPWVRLCLIQQAQKVRDEAHKAKFHQCSKCFWPAGTKRFFCCCLLGFCLF